jgi:formamidopyrimidine-DNA glycosylase
VQEDIAPTLRDAAARSRAPIRSLLLDQHVVAGLGNIYANEALARAGIHPLRRADSIAPRRIARLAIEVRAVLEEALAAGGTTLADGGFADAEGSHGYFAVKLSVYGREGEPCPRCGSTVRRLVAGNRSAFFCPRCQR